MIYHGWYSTCIGTLPRSLSSPCIVVEGKTMLCGRNGLVGLVPVGLCGAYEKYFDRGERAVLCCGKAGINKNCKAAGGKMPPMFEATAKDVCLCCVCVWTLPLTVCVPLGCLSQCYSEQTGAPGYWREQILSGQSDFDTSTIVLMTQLPEQKMTRKSVEFCDIF